MPEDRPLDGTRSMYDTENLIKRLLSSETKGDLLTLFHRNPGLIDTMEGIALRIGKRGDAIEAEVRDLADLGMLRISKLGDYEVVSLDVKRDMEIQHAITKYLESKSRGREV